jgi:RNA recognition motif-containing protein
VRWNSTKKDQQPSEKQSPRRPGGNLSKLAKKHGGPLTPDEEASTKGEALEYDIDYDDLYARSKAADLEAQKESAQERRRSRHQLLDEEMKQVDAVSASRKPTKNYEISPPCETVYVGNLFFDIAAEDLRAHFEQFGTVLNTTIVHDNRGISKG